MAPITSFIRWAGGKSWLVPFVQDLTMKLAFNNYYEPFMGGASVFFALDVPHHCVLSDMNSELVNVFCAVRDNPERVIIYLSDFKTDEEVKRIVIAQNNINIDIEDRIIGLRSLI